MLLQLFDALNSFHLDLLDLRRIFTTGTEDLEMAVNAAINLEKPLLIKGEPGTGKTELAKQVALKLGLELFEWNIKSTTKAHQGLYEYDAVSRLRDSQLGDKKVNDINNYINKGTIWMAFSSEIIFSPSSSKLR